MRRIVTTARTETGGVTGTRSAPATGEMTTGATTGAMTAETLGARGTIAVIGIDARVNDRRVAVRAQGVAESCALMASMRLRLTPRSLSPSRDAERTWITPAAGSYQNSVSSTNRNHSLVNCA